MAAPVSIGVMFRREQPPETLVTYARRVEAAGFDELWVVEDCFYTGGVAQAATALATTERVTVGLGIAPAVARNPAFLAMEFATLARMHPGRFHGGIGHGVAEWMDQIGAKPPSWLAAIEETTAAVRSLLRGDHVSTEGRSVRLRDVQLEHVPDPPPLVSLGVRSEKSLALAGRRADGTLLAEGSAPSYIAWARDRIKEGREDEAATAPHRVTVYALCDVNPADPDSARGAVKRALAPFMSAGSTSAQLAPLPYVHEIDALIAEGGMEALQARMPDAWLDDLSVSGLPHQAAEAVSRLRDAGANAVVLVPPDDADPDAWLDRVAAALPVLREGAKRGLH